MCHLGELQSCQDSTVDADRKHTVRSIDQILPEAMGEGHAAGDRFVRNVGADLLSGALEFTSH